MLRTGTLGQTHGLGSLASVVQVDHGHGVALSIPAPMLGSEQSAGCSWFTQYTESVDGACSGLWQCVGIFIHGSLAWCLDGEGIWKCLISLGPGLSHVLCAVVNIEKKSWHFFPLMHCFKWCYL